MDEMSRRIKQHRPLIKRYWAKNYPTLANWGLTDNEIDLHLTGALWKCLVYRDDFPDDAFGLYQRYWQFARGEFGELWRTMHCTKGTAGKAIYLVTDEPDDLPLPDNTCDPPELAGWDFLPTPSPATLRAWMTSTSR